MIEYRALAGTATEADGTITGMVTPFGVETSIGDLRGNGFREEIAPGTFTKTLQERAVVLIHNHDTAMPMARTSVPEGQEGHLSLTESPAGFVATGLPVDTSYSKDVRACAKAGILGMSFGFEVTKDDWYDSEGRASNAQAGTKRVIREVKLHEVSTTAFPAYGSTMGTVSARDTINAARGTEESRTESSDEKESRTVSAEIDAALDAAFAGITSVDRNALPAEINQFIDLASAALKLASADLKDSGIPDPDNPNGNDYSPDDGERSEQVETAPETDSQHSANLASMLRISFGIF